jgi:hypothetical protein
VKAFPADTAFAIEAPSSRYAALPPAERARLAVDASRALLSRAGVERDAGN